MNLDRSDNYLHSLHVQDNCKPVVVDPINDLDKKSSKEPFDMNLRPAGNRGLNSCQLSLELQKKQASALGGVVLSGKSQKLTESSQSPHKVDLKAKVFFKCLPRSITKGEVQSQFSNFGRVIQIRMPYSKKKQKFIGYGFAHFSDESIAQHLINNVRNLTIHGKQIALQRYTDVESLSWNDLKRINQIIDEYIEYEKKAVDNSSMTEHFDESSLPKPIIDQADRPYARSVFYTRWNLQTIKPIHRHYYSVRHMIKESTKAETDPLNNYMFRLKSPG